MGVKEPERQRGGGRTPGGELGVHYDELDLFYRRVWGEQVHHGLWRRGDESPGEAALGLPRLVGERLALGPGKRVCDVGCGYGRTAAWLAARFDVSVLGVTVSARQAERAAGRNDPGVEVRQADWMRNGLPDASFDAAFAIESLEHMADPARAVAEMARVVKPGGRLVLCCWLRASDARGWETRHLLDPVGREGRLPGMGTEAEVTRWLAAAGIAINGREDLSRQVERTWPTCLRGTLMAFFLDRELRRDLLGRHRQNRGFALALLRIWAAYRLGAMRYLVFTGHKPEVPAAGTRGGPSKPV